MLDGQWQVVTPEGGHWTIYPQGVYPCHRHPPNGLVKYCVSKTYVVKQSSFSPQKSEPVCGGLLEGFGGGRGSST
jgi:hypothetical protein